MSDDLKSELWKLTVESRKLRADIQRLEMMLSSVKSERDHAVQQLGASRAENKRLMEKNKSLQKENTTLAINLNSFSIDAFCIDKLREENYTLQSEIESLRQDAVMKQEGER